MPLKKKNVDSLIFSAMSYIAQLFLYKSRFTIK